MLLQQSGVPTHWWTKAIRHYCFLHNVTRKAPGEPAPWELRFGTAFNGPLLAFGSEVSYKSAISDPNDGLKFGPSSKQAVIVGYFLNPGGAWSKDYLVYDLETIRQNKDCRRIRVRRCGEVFQKRGIPTFPMQGIGAPGDLVPLPPQVPPPEVLSDKVDHDDAVDLPDPWEDMPNEKLEAPSVPAPAEPSKAPAEAEAEKTKDAKPKYVAGQWVGDQVLDPDRIPKGYKCEDGRITRQNRRTSGRPEGIWPEIWSMMTPKDKKEAQMAAKVKAEAATCRLVLL